MNLERAATNTLIIPGRQLTGETHYLLVFTRVDNGGVAKVITTNAGSARGPLMLAFDEADDGVAADGDVELAAGDWQLVVYTQGNGTNLVVGDTLREIWEEQIRVDGEGGDIPDPETCDPVTVSNSTDSYSQIVQPGGTLELADITHTDSDGSSVVRPAMVSFTATLCGASATDYYYATSIGHP